MVAKSPITFVLLLLIPALFAMVLRGDRYRASALACFGPAGGMQVSRRKRWWKRTLALAAMLSLIAALSHPVWRVPDARAQGNTGDVVFVLDVSRSMLSSDAQPSRLANAKSIAGELAAQFHGERMALVTFAGTPAVQCPLTIDQAFFRDTLARASPDSVSRGGSKLGDAIRFALDSVFDNIERGRKVLILLTDGGDQDSSPESAAAEAARRGIRLVVIGVGDAQQGALVPVSEIDPTPMKYRGVTVVTRLETERLRTIAASGVYLVAGTSQLEPGETYRNIIASGRPRVKNEHDASPIFLALAVALLVIESFLSERKSLAALILLLLPAGAWAETPAKLVAMGNRAFQAAHYDTAVFLYQSAAAKAPGSPEVQYNLGAALLRLRMYSPASQAFERAAAAAHGTPLEAKSALGQADCAYHQAVGAPPLEEALKLNGVLILYRKALALDPSLADAQYNIGVVEKRLAELRQRLSSTNPRMVTSSNDARDIVRQGRLPGDAARSLAGRERVDKDW